MALDACGAESGGFRGHADDVVDQCAGGQYGLTAETSGKNGDPKAEHLTLDGTLKIAALNSGVGATTTFQNLPAIRFLPDGTVDEGSPQTVQLSDQDGFGRWLVELPNRTGYEISDRNK